MDNVPLGRKNVGGACKINIWRKKMKKYISILVILIIQLLCFYVLPIFVGPKDPFAMVFMIILATLILSLILGILSKTKVKFLYPIAIAVLFIPSVFIYYNESALIHSLWYLGISFIGVDIGAAVSKFFLKNQKND